MGRVDAVVTEIKAAAIDVVAEEAAARGLPVIFMDNVPVEVSPDGGLIRGAGALGGPGPWIGRDGEREVRAAVVKS